MINFCVEIEKSIYRGLLLKLLDRLGGGDLDGEKLGDLLKRL